MLGIVQEQMLDGINESAVVLVCVTKAYLSKVTQPQEGRGVDNCRFKLMHAAQNNSTRFMTVAMERSVRNALTWPSKYQVAGLKYLLCHDLSNDVNFCKVVRDVCDEVLAIVDRYNL